MTTGSGRLLAAGLAFGAMCVVGSGQSQAQQGAPETAVELLNPLAGFDPSSLDAFRDRPLFSPSRRAAPDPVRAEEPVAAIAEPSLNIRLLGLTQSPQGAVAMLVDLDDGATHSVREGEMFRDWMVERLDPSGLTLRQAAETLVLVMFEDGPRASNGDEASAPVAPADPDQPTRQVRMIEPTGQPSDTAAGDTPGSLELSAQDLIDFFGPSGQPAQ